VVVHSGFQRGYGQSVEIRHSDGQSSFVAHLQPVGLPKRGQKVTAGTQVGAVGRTGNVPQEGDPHVHWEIRKGSSKAVVDPEAYFPKQRGS
jgi:murein DD-endopeptidase MepM/ murein hydrolase activator NlpD